MLEQKKTLILFQALATKGWLAAYVSITDQQHSIYRFRLDMSMDNYTIVLGHLNTKMLGKGYQSRYFTISLTVRLHK